MRIIIPVFASLALLLSSAAAQQEDGEAAPEAPANGRSTSLSDPDAQPTWIEHDTVVLQGLDKVTARISTFEVGVDQQVRFGDFEIVPRACRKRPPHETPESAAFLEIVENDERREPKPLFSGWMFASSPALSAVDHPVYDVWVLDCKGERTPDEANAGEDAPPAE